ncbi:MAG: hypothetical protein WBE71_03045 [Xanthobacteraceae bacterium]
MAQVIAAVIGAAFVIGLLVASIMSYGTLSRASVVESQVVVAHVPGLDSFVWWPAHAALGDGFALAGVLALSLALLAAVIALVAPRFGEYAVTASSAAASTSRNACLSTKFHSTSPRGALRRKEWTLLRRDPWLVSQTTLMQMLYLIPPGGSAVAQFRRRQRRLSAADPGPGHGGGAACRRSLLARDFRRRRARCCRHRARSAELCHPRQDRGRARRHRRRLRAPLVVVLAIASPWRALITCGGIVVAAGAATSIQLWFRSHAKRSQFRRRQVSSRVATFAEAFSSIGWAATAAVAAVNLWLAIAPGLVALAVVAGARFMSPRPKHA